MPDFRFGLLQLLSLSIFPLMAIGPFEFKVEGCSKTTGEAEGCDVWDQNGDIETQIS